MKLKHLLALAAFAVIGGGNSWAQQSYTEGVEVAAGTDYFLYNVESGKFLTDGMDWGTHATVDNAGRVITFELNDGKYAIKTKTYVNDEKVGYMTDNGYLDTSGAQYWEFVPTNVDGYTNAYIIKQADDKVLHLNTADCRVNVGAASGNAATWIIVPMTARQEAKDYTYLLQNTDFNRPWERAIWEGAKDNNGKAVSVGGNENNRCQERYNMTFDVYQTVSNVPNGKWKLYCQGFYRAGGGGTTSTAQNALLYINDTTSPLTNVNTEGQSTNGNGFSLQAGVAYVPNSMADASTVFTAGYYNNNSVTAVVTNGTLRVGIKKTVAVGADWTIFDNFRLEYLGEDLADYAVPLADAQNAAKALQGKLMNKDVATALEDAITNYGDKTQEDYTTVSGITTAITALNTATTNATTSINIYAAITAKYNTLDDAGKTAFEATTNGTKYVAKTLVNEDCVADLATAAKAQTTEGADMTLAIVNPTVDGITGWTESRPKGGNGPLLGGTAFEYWAGNASSRSEASFDYYQVIEGLVPGVYEVSAEMSNSLNGEAGATFNESCGVYGNNTIAYVTTEGDARNKYTATVTVTNGTLRLGVKSDKTMGARWFTADNFTLTFVNAISLDDYRNNIASLISQANAITGKQQASLATALADAISAAEGYESETDIETLNGMIDGLNEAIANSNASVAAYAALNSAFNDIYVDRSAAFGAEFTYRAEAQTMYDEATAATADVQAKADGMQLAYRNYVKDIATNYPTVEGVKEARDVDAWVFTTDPKNKGNYNNTANNDIAANVMRENWKGGAMEGDMKQTVSVPNGKYFLRMVSFTRNSPNTNDYIYIKSGETTETSVTFGTGDNAFVNITNPIEVTNGEVEIGLHIGSGADWAAIGGVVLYAMPEDITRTTATEKYGTICTPYAATVEGAKIYSASINDEKTAVTLEEVEDGNLVAGNPYIYQATDGTQTFSYASGNIITEPVANGPLTGVFTSTPVPVGKYVMQTQDDVQQFYIVVEGKQPTLSEYKAYLSVPSEAKSLKIGLAAETAIKAIDALMSGDAKIYDINGREQKSLQKGVNIVNGVKVMVK